MITIRNTATAEIRFVQSIAGFDAAVWVATGDTVPADLATRPYIFVAGVLTPGVAPVPTPVTAYEIARAAGFVGTQAAWLASLAGVQGGDAYAVAVAAGFAGTRAAWLASLVGASGADAYAVAVAGGFAGTRAAWLASLQGPAGITGVTTLVKAADEGRLNAALADDAALTAVLAINAVYRVEVEVYLAPSLIAAGAKWQLTGPAGAVLMMLESNAAPNTAVFGLATARSLVTASVATYRVFATGTITTGATAGNLTLQWAQNVLAAASATTLKRGSMLRLTKLIL